MWVSLLDSGCECDWFGRLVDLGMVIFGAHKTALKGVPVAAPQCGLFIFYHCGHIKVGLQ